MAQHPIINPSAEMLPLRIASKALDTAKSMQTRKSASAYYTDIDGKGIIIGSNSTDGINRYDPITGDLAPLWEGVTQEELDRKATEILNSAKDSTKQQIRIIDEAIKEAQKEAKGLKTESDDGAPIATIGASGVYFGDSLSYVRKNGIWTLSLAGDLQSGSTISAVTLKGALTVIGGTLQTSVEDKVGIKITDGGIVAYKDKETSLIISNDGTLETKGAILTDAEIRSPKINAATLIGGEYKSVEDENRGIRIVGKKLDAYDDNGRILLRLDGATGEAMLTGGMRTAYSGPRLEIQNERYYSPGTNVIQGTMKGYDSYGEAWHITGVSTRESATGLDYSISLYMGISSQQPEIQIMRDFKNSYTSLNLMADRLNIVGSQKSGMPYPAGVYVNNHRIDDNPDMYCGSIVIQPGGNGTRHTLFDQAKWKSLTGQNDMGARNPVVLVSNGDVGANNVGIAGAGYSAADKRWYVYLTAATNRAFRVNFCILIRQ